MYHAVAWDDLNLRLLFSTGDFYRSDGVEHFVGWTHWATYESPLRTRLGIGIGYTMAELVAAHGDEVVVPAEQDECMPTHYVWLKDSSTDMKLRVLVSLDGPPDDGSRSESRPRRESADSGVVAEHQL